MVGANVDPGKAQAEVAKAQLEKLGFKVRLRLVPQDAVYTDWCQVPAKKVAVCGGAGWFKDFADPAVDARAGLQGLADHRRRAEQQLRAAPRPEGRRGHERRPRCSRATSACKAWADIDKMIIDDAPAIPFVWDKTTLIRSKNVNGVAQRVHHAPGTSASPR